MPTVNENYPKSNFEISDEELKRIAIQNMEAQQTRNSGFPTEIISLPSQGKVYTAENPLSSGKIEMKYMTAREEDILTSQNLIKQGIVLDRLMQSLIVSQIKFDDLIIGDKNAVMVAARILGYGKDYNVDVKCPKCNEKNHIYIDLTQLPEEHIPEGTEMPAPGIFKFTLPQSKRTVQFRLLTTGDDKRISRELELRKKTDKSGIDRELTTRLKAAIVTVDDIADRKHVENFVDNELFALDSRSLRTCIRAVSPDIKFEVPFQCTSCSHEEEALAFNMDTNFFWPKS
jgi:hypothetical protein